MSQTLELVSSGGNLTLDAGNIVAKDLEKIATGVGTARVEVPENDSIIPYVQRQDRVNYKVDGSTVFSGYAVGFRGNERSGKWTLRVDGVGKRLEETRPDYDSLGGSLTYSNIALDEALKDYWPRTPFSATVTDQTPEVVANDEELQSADTQTEWENITSLSATDPITLANDSFEPEQTSYHQDARDASGTFSQGTASEGGSNDYVDGFAAFLDSASANISFSINLPYTIPESDVGLAVRQGADDAPGVEWKINGQVVDSVSAAVGNLSFGWTDSGDGEFSGGSGWTGGDLSGTVNIEIDVVDFNTGENLAVDWIVLYDQRFNYTFDNNTDSNQELSGPELYPDSFQFAFDTADTSFNISEGTINSTWDNTTGVQELALSNDGGSTYTTQSNTENLTVNFANAGRQAKTRVTLGRYGTQTETPTNGVNGQTIDDYTLTVDLTDTVVIDELELSRNHFENLKKLHDYGDFVYTIEHDSGDLDTLTVNSYPRGQITKSTPSAFDDPENINPEVAAETYFNSIYLQGQLRDDGTRPTAEVKLQDTIDNDNREISPGVLRDPSISTDAGAEFRANALLSTALDKNDLRGSISTHPVYVHPGYEYEIDFAGDGSPEQKTSERVSIRESAGSLSATYDFVVKEALAETIDELKQDTRDVSDQV